MTIEVDTDRLDCFFAAYVECGLWASTDENDKSLGAGDGPNEREDMSLGLTVEDLADGCAAACRADCAAFYAQHAAYLDTLDDRDLARAGHDFWLTRCGAGAGFWDGRYPEEWECVLTDSAHTYGDVWLYVGDDGKVYCG